MTLLIDILCLSTHIIQHIESILWMLTKSFRKQVFLNLFIDPYSYVFLSLLHPSPNQRSGTTPLLTGIIGKYDALRQGPKWRNRNTLESSFNRKINEKQTTNHFDWRAVPSYRSCSEFGGLVCVAFYKHPFLCFLAFTVGRVPSELSQRVRFGTHQQCLLASFDILRTSLPCLQHRILQRTCIWEGNVPRVGALVHRVKVQGGFNFRLSSWQKLVTQRKDAHYLTGSNEIDALITMQVPEIMLTSPTNTISIIYS